MGIQCVVDKMHADWNKWMGDLLAEARADLVSTLSSGPAGGDGSAVGSDAGAKKAERPAPESVDQTIERILKDK
jgi:hypothetical protein